MASKKATALGKLRSMTLKQLNEAEWNNDDSVSYLYDQPIDYMIEIIGEIKLITERPNGFDILIANNGSSFLCKTLTSEYDINDVDGTKLFGGLMVKIFGVLNVYNGDLYLNTFRIRLVMDMNDFKYHDVDALYSLLDDANIDEKYKILQRPWMQKYDMLRHHFHLYRNIAF